MAGYLLKRELMYEEWEFDTTNEAVAAAKEGGV